MKAFLPEAPAEDLYATIGEGNADARSAAIWVYEAEDSQREDPKHTALDCWASRAVREVGAAPPTAETEARGMRREEPRCE